MHMNYALAKQAFLSVIVCVTATVYVVMLWHICYYVTAWQVIKLTTMNGYRFYKFFVAIIIQVGIIFTIFVVHRRMSAPSFSGRLSYASTQVAHLHHCNGHLSGRIASVQQTTNSSNLKSFDRLLVAPTDKADAKFLIDYEAYCRMNLIPKASNVFVLPSELDNCSCPCIPSGLGMFKDSRWKICGCDESYTSKENGALNIRASYTCMQKSVIRTYRNFRIRTVTKFIGSKNTFFQIMHVQSLLWWLL